MLSYWVVDGYEKLNVHIQNVWINKKCKYNIKHETKQTNKKNEYNWRFSMGDIEMLHSIEKKKLTEFAKRWKYCRKQINEHHTNEIMALFSFKASKC